MSLPRRALILILALPPTAIASAGRTLLIAPAGERGTPVEISGTIYAEDGVTSVPETRIFVYQTDTAGHYGRGSGEPRDQARLRAFGTADAQGRYTLRTIKPGAYPDSQIPAHIHVHLGPPATSDRDLVDYRYSVSDFLFDDDPKLTAATRSASAGRGRFAYILKLTRGSDGVWRGTRDLRVGDKGPQ